MFQLAGLPLGVVAVILTVVIANLGNNIISPVMPVIRDQFGASAAGVGLVASGFAFGRLVTDLPAGYMTSRISPNRMFAVGILVSGVAAALAAFSTSLVQVVLFRTMMGLGTGIMSTVALVVLVDLAGPERRGEVLGYYTSGLLLGQAVSPSVGGYLATAFDWRAPFLFCAITPLISLPLNLLAVSRIPTGQKSGTSLHEPPSKGPVLSDVPVVKERAAEATNWPALAAVYLSTFANFFNRQGMRQAILPLYGGMMLGMEPGTIGTILTTGAVATILVNLPSGRLADRIGRKRLLIPGMMSLCAGNAILLMANGQFLFALSTIFVSMGVLANSMQSGLVADLVPQSWMGQGMGMYRFTADLAMVVGPVVLGTVVDSFGFAAAAATAAVVVLIAVAAAQLLIPRRTGYLSDVQPS